jgi:hypothetical protein
MSKNFGTEWLRILQERFGEVNHIHEIHSVNKPNIYVFFFEELPEPGYMTAITCGLSNADRPEWKIAKPELMVSLKTMNKGWGLGIGYFASAFFNEKVFRYGDVFTTDGPISEESAMNGFLVFAPPFL